MNPFWPMALVACVLGLCLVAIVVRLMFHLEKMRAGTEARLTAAMDLVEKVRSEPQRPAIDALRFLHEVRRDMHQQMSEHIRVLERMAEKLMTDTALARQHSIERVTSDQARQPVPGPGAGMFVPAPLPEETVAPTHAFSMES